MSPRRSCCCASCPLGKAGGCFLGGLVIAALFASNVRQAFLKPIFLVMVMTKFHVVVRGQAINLEWDGRLTGVSYKFRELRDKALGGPPLLRPLCWGRLTGVTHAAPANLSGTADVVHGRGEQHERTSGGDVCGRDGCRVDRAGRGPGRGAEGGTGVRRGTPRLDGPLRRKLQRSGRAADDKIVVCWESTDPDAGQMKVTLDARLDLCDLS